MAACQVGITLSSLVVGYYGQAQLTPLLAPLLARLGLPSSAAVTVSVLLVLFALTFLQVVFGELLPKSISLRFPERMALIVLRPMRWSLVVLRPLISLLNGSALLILRRFGRYGVESSHVHQPDELEAIFSESAAGGLIDAGEREMLARPRIVALPADSSWEELRRAVDKNRHSRFPVYRGDLDQVVGILHVRDFIERDVSGQQTELVSLVRRVPRVPEAMSIERLLGSFKRLHVHMAVVVAEYGGTSGIVTLDDIIEEVVGDVEDEFDVGERPGVEPQADGTFLVAGGLPLYQFNERFDSRLQARDSTTVGGFVLEQLMRLPEPGDEVAADGLLLRVEEMAGLAIGRLLVVPPARSRQDE